MSVSLSKPVNMTKRERPGDIFRMPQFHSTFKLGVAMGNPFRGRRPPLTAHVVLAPTHCDRCGKPTVSLTLGIRDCPDRCRRPVTN